jgi:hypothetical protein
MTAIGWQGRLNEAVSTEDVGAVVTDYLATWNSAALAELPISCKPDELLAVSDISPFALKLIRQLGIGNRASAPLLYELTTFFTKAALRLAQIGTQAATVAAERRSRGSD